jgi:cyclopropane fatty-acyl-phospholipid synthase-like methyltransferase
VICSSKPIGERDVALHYDELDGFYREMWGEHLHHGLWRSGDESPEEAVRALVRKVASVARVEEGSSLCDVGSGYGATARMLASELGAEVTAFTVSPVQHAVAAAVAVAHPSVRPVLASWLEYAVEPGGFDAVIAIESTEHMADKPRFFEQSARALRPGGRIAICAWLAAEDASRFSQRFLLEPICSEGRLPSMGSIADYRGWLENAGFTDVVFEDLTSAVDRTWTISVRRVLARLATPSAWRYLLDSANRNRIFALTVLRILVAYRTGAMQYGIFGATLARV